MTDKNNIQGDQENDGEFKVPGDYFEASAKRIRLKIEWEDEHAPYAFLKAHRSTDHFLVPENYFQPAAESAEFPSLFLLRKQMPFQVPVEYFKQQSADLRTALLSPDTGRQETLQGLPRENPFLLSDNYFENSANTITGRLRPSQEARVIRLIPARITWAAAALLAVVSGFLVYNSYFFAEEKDCGTIACIDKAELIKAASIENLDDEDLYELIDMDDLEHTLENKKRENRTRPADSTYEDFLNDI